MDRSIPPRAKAVLVHGALDRSKSFLPVVECLPELRVTEYDRRGYGESLVAGPATFLAQHVDDLLGVMGEEPTTVVAHSFGCLVAVSAAIRAPQPVSGARPVGATGALDGVLAEIGSPGARGDGGRGRHGCAR